MADGTGRADGRRDLAAARPAIGRKRSRHIVGRAAAHALFQENIGGDLVQGDVARPFRHGLAAHLPAQLGQFAVGDHLGHLGPVVAVVDGPGPDAVAQGQHGVVFLHQAAEPVELLVQRIFPVVSFHPGDHERAALGNQTAVAESLLAEPFHAEAVDAALMAMKEMPSASCASIRSNSRSGSSRLGFLYFRALRGTPDRAARSPPAGTPRPAPPAESRPAPRRPKAPSGRRPPRPRRPGPCELPAPGSRMSEEAPTEALTLVRKPRPMPAVRWSGRFGWRGITMRPAATRSRTSSGSIPSSVPTVAISGVTTPSRARSICVFIPLPSRLAQKKFRAPGDKARNTESVDVFFRHAVKAGLLARGSSRGRAFPPVR